MKLSGVSILGNRRENLKINVVLVVVLVPESKAPYCKRQIDTNFDFHGL